MSRNQQKDRSYKITREEQSAPKPDDNTADKIIRDQLETLDGGNAGDTCEYAIEWAHRLKCSMGGSCTAPKCDKKRGGE